MKHNSPFGVGRLMRAAICGLLAATVIPVVASAETTTTTAPFSGPVTNTCVVPAEEVTLNGTMKTTTIEQQDGSIGTYMTFNGTSVTVTANYLFVPVKYSFSHEFHGWVNGGPGDSFLTFYDYMKITRAGETGTTLFEDDDFYTRVFFRFPLGPGGVPNMNSLNTNPFSDPIIFECR